MKYCPKCKTKKQSKEFYKDKRTPDGLYGICKKCHNELSNKASYEKRLEKSKKNWKEKQPKCFFCNKTIPFERFYISGNSSQYCSDECLSQRGKKHYQENKEEINTRNKPRRKEYYEKVIKANKKVYEIPCKFCGKIITTTSSTRRYCSDRCRINFYRNKKYNNDPLYKLEVSLRGRIRQAIKYNTKTKKTMELVGCTIEELKEHLESQFTDGMTWENHTFDGWHIDHILPCASFDLSDPEEQKKCFHYTNLQPLWGIDNMKKGDKII